MHAQAIPPAPAVLAQAAKGALPIPIRHLLTFIDMRQFSQFLVLLLLAAAMVPTMRAQQTGIAYYGDNNKQVAAAITRMNDGSTRIAGNTLIPNNGSPLYKGYVTQHSTLGIPTFTKQYDLGSGRMQILDIANSPLTGLTAAVGWAEPGTPPGNRDGFFMNMGTNGVPQHLRVWNSTSDIEIPRRVKVLADGSFVIVGKVIRNGITQSFITRIGIPTVYSLHFHRVIGNPNADINDIDEAVAVEQLPDGRLLVAGTTRQFDKGTQGSPYIAVLALDGTLLEYHTYPIQKTVISPTVTDMLLLSSGNVVLIGNTLDPSGFASNFGFLMNVNSNLQTATFFEAQQPGATFGTVQFNSIVHSGFALNYFVAGSAAVSSNGVLSRDGLIMRFNINGGIEFAKTIGFPEGDNEFFYDLTMRDNNNSVEMVGSTQFHALFQVGFAQENLLIARTDLLGNNCLSQTIGLTFTQRTAGHFVPLSVTTSPSMQLSVGTAAFPASSMNDFVVCDNSKTAPVAIPEESLATAVFPNPASGVATVRIGGLEGSAHVQLMDLSGRILRQVETSTAETEIDLHGLASGMYLVHIATKGERITRKLQVQ